MLIEKSRLPARAMRTAAQCSGTLPTSGTTTMPMKTVPMPSSSIVGSIADTSSSDIAPGHDGRHGERDQRGARAPAPLPSWPCAEGGCVNEYSR